MPHGHRIWSPPKSTFVSWRGRDRQLRDRRWQICLTTNVHLSAYWRALSHWWFMLKILHIHYHFHHLRHSSFQHLPVCTTQHSAHRHKVKPCYRSFPRSLVCKENSGFILGKNLRASSIFIQSAIALPEEDYTVYLWMILFTSVHRPLVCNRSGK